MKLKVRHDDGQHAGRDQKVMSEIFLTRLLATKVRVIIHYPRRHSRRRGVGVQTRLSVCLFVLALKGKRLESSTPNLVHIYSIAVARHALTQKSKGQRSRSHSYENCLGRAVASDLGQQLCCVFLYLRRFPAWVCMSIRLPMCSC